jgi:uncharacterized membrane protein HdeD (DUF308 family)
MSPTKPIRKPVRRESRWQLFDKINYWIFLAGVVTILLGYLAMSQGPHDSFMSLHLAPLLLVLGYCVLIPLAILLRLRQPKPKGE